MTITKSNPKPKRRWLRFSIRSLFLFVGATSIPLAWYVNTARQQRLAVEALERVGARISYDFEYDDGLHLPKVIQGKVAPKWLRSLVGRDLCSSVDAVDVDSADDGVDYSNKVMPYIAALPTLSRITLIGSTLKDSDIESLRSQSKLDWLVLDDAPLVTDKSLDTIIALHVHDGIVIRHTGISKDGSVVLRAASPGVRISYE